VGGEGGGEGEAEGCSGAFGLDDAFLDECRDDSAGLALAGADDGVGVSAWEFAAIKEGFEDGAGF